MLEQIPGLIEHSPTGSYYICNPPILNTDKDTIILVKNQAGAFAKLIRDGWKMCGDEEMYGHDGKFVAVRRDEENYILTDNLVYYDKFCAATELAKKRNLLKKEDRVMLFQIILDE